MTVSVAVIARGVARGRIVGEFAEAVEEPERVDELERVFRRAAIM